MSKTKFNQKQFLIYQQYQRIHFFLFIVSLVVFLIVFLVMSTIFLETTKATSILLSLAISNPSETSVTTQESTTITSGGGLALLRAPSLAKELALQPMPPSPAESTGAIAPVKVSINLLNQSGNIIEGGSASNYSLQSIVPQISNSRPVFSGQVDLPYAFIFLEIHSGPVNAITTSFNADANGFWSYQPFQPLAAGSHLMYLTVFDPTGEAKLAAVDYQFEVLSTEETTKVATEIKPGQSKKITAKPSLVDSGQALFDVRVKLTGSIPHEIQPGDDFYAQIYLTNVGETGKLVDVIVKYQIVDEKQKIIFEQGETLAVSTQASFLKTFSTKPNLSPGNYSLAVSVDYDHVQAVSVEKFAVKGEPVLIMPGRTKVNISAVVQILALILIISSLIAYFEYKQVESLRRVIHQVTEKDLKKEGLIS